MWIETRTRTTFNGSERSVERKRSPKSGAQHEEHLPNAAPRRAALDQAQINKAVVPQWPPRSQGQTQARRRHSHEGGHGSKTWWQKNARRLEPRRSLRCMRDCHRKLLWKEDGDAHKSFYQSFKGLQRRQLYESSGPMCKQVSLGADAFAGIDNILGVSQTGMEITKQVEIGNGRTEKKSWRSNPAGRHHTTGTVEGRMRNE